MKLQKANIEALYKLGKSGTRTKTLFLPRRTHQPLTGGVHVVTSATSVSSTCSFDPVPLPHVFQKRGTCLNMFMCVWLGLKRGRIMQIISLALFVTA